MVVVFPGAVHADDHDHKRAGGGERDRFFLPDQDLEHLLLQRLFQKIGVFEFFAPDFLGDMVQEKVRGLDADIAGDKGFFQLREKVVIDLFLPGDELVDLGDQTLVGFKQAFFQAVEKPFLFFGHDSLQKQKTQGARRKA